MRSLSSLLLLALGTTTLCCTDDGDGGPPTGRHGLDPETERAIAVTRSATTCPAHLDRYPVNAAHNGGWDPNALTYTCPVHPASSKDNSDFIAGDHFGNDIFGAKGSALVACVDGTIVNKSTTTIGGNNVTIKDSCGWYYYYAHMNAFAGDIKEGMAVKAGHYLGELGKTGNASTTSPHLHFSIYPGVYNDGIDPFPLLQTVDASSCGEAPPPAGPAINIWSSTSAPDVRPEGTSAGIGDAFEGDTFTVDVFVENAGSANTPDYVQIGYWVETPWLVPVGYTIYTDWPAKDKKTWQINDADSAPGNPSKTEPPGTAKMNLYAFGKGETKRVSFKVKAVQYSLGEVDHPDLRAWVWHVGNYYGEMESFYDAVETNLAGKELKTYAQHDVYGKTHWEWNATKPETEGWTAGNAISELAVNTVDHCLAAKQAGEDPYFFSPATTIPTGTWKGIQLRVRGYEGTKTGRLYWITNQDGQWADAKSVLFGAAGDGQFHEVTINTSASPLWKDTVTQLRIDPATSGAGWVDIDWLRAVKDPGATSGDGDGDGYVVGVDCNDSDAAVHPGAIEVCNGLDDDCNGVVDNGVPKGGAEACNGIDDDCDGTVPADEADADGDGQRACAGDCNDSDAAIHAGATELCDGLDNDCDGKADETFLAGAVCTVGVGACLNVGTVSCQPNGDTTCSVTAGVPVSETCNGQDDDCDGTTDEDYGLGQSCTSSSGACTKKGVIVCSTDGQTAVCNAPAAVPTVDVCNGEDDDCDGDVDEGFGVGTPCTSGDGACQVSGFTACGDDGTAFCKASAPAGSAELCDGTDNDCDGQTDEGFPVGGECTVYQGECETWGAWACDPTGLGTQCDVEALAPGAPCPKKDTGGDGGGSGDAGGKTSSVGGSSGDGGCATSGAPSGGLWLAIAVVVVLGSRRRRASAMLPR